MVKMSRSLYREVAIADEDRRIYRIGEHYQTIDETLQKVGYPPNRRHNERGQPRWTVA